MQRVPKCDPQSSHAFNAPLNLSQPSSGTTGLLDAYAQTCLFDTQRSSPANRRFVCEGHFWLRQCNTTALACALHTKSNPVFISRLKWNCIAFRAFGSLLPSGYRCFVSRDNCVMRLTLELFHTNTQPRRTNCIRQLLTRQTTCVQVREPVHGAWYVFRPIIGASGGRHL